MPTSKIKVTYQDGSKASSVKVVLGFSGGMSKTHFTDSSGEATIEHLSTGTADIYVRGSKVGSMTTPGTASVTLN